MSQDLPIGLLRDIHEWARQFASRLDEMEELLSENRIWKERTIDVGLINAEQVCLHQLLLLREVDSCLSVFMRGLHEVL